MSSIQANDQDTVPAVSGSALRSPLVIAAQLLAFAVACLGAYGVSSNISSTYRDGVSNRRLVTSALALLHARMEQQAAITSLIQAGDSALKILQDEVHFLTESMKKLELDIHTERTLLASLRKSESDESIRQKALLVEKKNLEDLQNAFKAALGAKTEAGKAIASSMGSAAGTLSKAKFEEWKGEWARVTAEAVKKIDEANNSLASAEAKAEEWSQGQESFSPDRKKEVQTELKSLYNTATDRLSAAREAAAMAEKELKSLLDSQRLELNKAMTSLPR